MRKKLATYALAATVAAGGAALIVPAVSYAATGDSTRLTGRVAAIQDALKGLVTDGTLTQEQADEVATTLAETRPERPSGDGHRKGPFGGGQGKGPFDMTAAAEALGITAEELRAAAQSGKTLAALADEQGVSQDELVSALVAAHDERLAAAVEAGRLTQAQADEKSAGAKERITASLDDPIRAKGGPRGGGPGRPGVPSEEPSDTATESPNE